MNLLGGNNKSSFEKNIIIISKGVLTGERAEGKWLSHL